MPVLDMLFKSLVWYFQMDKVGIFGGGNKNAKMRYGYNEIIKQDQARNVNAKRPIIPKRPKG